MNDLIYISLPRLCEYDPVLFTPDYAHHQWFHLNSALNWPPHTTSRVERLDTPWPLAHTVCAIPEYSKIPAESFDIVIESIADEFVNYCNKSQKKPYVCWSGGIDSTAIVVSLLKTAPRDFLDNVTILVSDSILQENGYFYHRFLKNQLHCENIDQFEITESNYQNIVITDGEAGNQIMGHGAINRLIYAGRADLLIQRWQTQDLSMLFMGSNTYHHELIRQSIARAPVDVVTGWDFLWWTNFNFKFDDVLLRKSMNYMKNLTPIQCQQFWKEGIWRFYPHKKMQQWSMSTMHVRRESSSIMPKYVPKKYIFDYDRNPFWFSNKSEEGSTSELFFAQPLGRDQSVFALDQDWNKYSIADQNTRQQLGKILQRIKL
jgi:hypothetical protein